MLWLRLSRVARTYGQGLDQVAEWPIDAFRWAEAIDVWERREADKAAAEAKRGRR